MKKFKNTTSNGNEKAIRRGKTVPDGDINLAWVKSPKFSPQNNMVVLDTSNLLLENSQKGDHLTKFMYANHLGILQDEFGNEVIFDEYPAITDEFTVEENYEITESNEFLQGFILAYRHISRYFHVDQEDLVLSKEPISIFRKSIIVENEDGKEYLDKNGKRRYKIKLVKSDDFLKTEDRTIGVYRVWVFVDTDINENLYLRYNKVELSANGANLKNQDINYREILNPQPYFKYIPEESDVVDFANQNNKVFTTKSSSQKEQILGVPRSAAEGYKVYVPRKAIQDPRLFQIFRWRIKADFEERYTVDPTSDKRVINAGILTRNYTEKNLSSLSSQNGGSQYNYLNPPTNYPYVFYNLEKSDYNPVGAKIVNPISENRGYTIVEDVDPAVQSPSDGNAAYNNASFVWNGNITAPLKSVSGEEAKEYANYWLVNLDTVSEDDLKKFDILILDPKNFPEDISSYLPKIMRFTKDFGGSIYIPIRDSKTKIGFGLKNTLPVHPYTGAYKVDAFASGVIASDRSYGLGDTISQTNSNDEIFNGESIYGGWDFESTALKSISPLKFHPNSLYAKANSYTQFIYSAQDTPTSDGLEYWKTLFNVLQSGLANQTSNYKATTVIKRFASGGSIIYDTLNIIGECNSLEDSVNTSPRRLQIPNYFEQINAGRFEGSYKFAWNWILSTIRRRPLDSSDESKYASSWSFETEWKSSWVINGTVLKDVEKLKYNFNYESKDITLPNDLTWRRRLAYGVNSAKSPVFKTLKEIVDEQIVKEMGQDFLRMVSGSNRKYTIEVTNSNVQVPTTLSDSMYPYAWTTSYSPDFVIPPNFGPHIIKDDPIMAEYSAGQYIDRTYPSNKFAVKIKSSYRDTSQSVQRETTTILARYRGTEILKSGQYYSNVYLPRTWTEHGSNQLLFNRFDKNWGAPRPNSILSRNELYLGRTSSYPFAGISGNFDRGNTGEVVRYIQYALNKLNSIIRDLNSKGINGPTPYGMTRANGYTEAMKWAIKYTHTKDLDQSGVYDDSTYNAVQAFKTLAGARYIDGVADSEFFSILGSQIQFWGLTTDTNQLAGSSGSFETSAYNYLRYSAGPSSYMNLRSISDSSIIYNYLEMSDSRRSIDRISDVFVLQYPKVYDFDYVSITPYLLGKSSNVNIDFVDIRKTRIDTTRFTGDMLNKAWQYFEVEEQAAPGNGWIPDSPRILWAQNGSEEFWVTNGVKQNTSDYRYWSGISKYANGYGLYDFFGGYDARVQYTKMIQRALLVNPDGVFGPVTAAAAYRWKANRAYQWGIPVDNTWGLISNITNIQQLLHVTVDGFYGPETERAVMNWQAQWGGAMPIDGFWGPITQKFTDDLFIWLGGLPTVKRIQHHLPEPYFVWPEDMLRTYDSSKALVKNINKTARSGELINIPIPKTGSSTGNTIIVGLSSSSNAGPNYGNQIELGISDISGYGKDLVGFTTLSGANAEIDYEGVVRKTFEVYGELGPIQLNHNYNETGAPGKLINVEWGIDPISEVSTSITPNFDPVSVGLYRVESSNPKVEAFITKDGKLYLRTDEVINRNNAYTEGRWLPGPPDQPLEGIVSSITSRSSSSVSTLDVSKNPIYSMDENGRLFPGVETGFISKADGIKLLCDINGNPVGMPKPPSGVGPEEFQRHYIDLELETYATSPFVSIGFYDKNQKEFIINSDGSSKMSYIEYMKRGPSNVYIGVISEAQVIEKKSYPPVLDGLNELPFKYAMPVYGASFRTKSKIGIEKIDGNLGITDIWGIPLRAGSFNRNVSIPPNTTLPIGGWLSEYQGKSVQAFYSIPEANLMSWSKIFGRPYVDIVGEHPVILSEDVIQVKQAPIHMIIEPTTRPSLSDPQRPIVKIYTRESTNDPWIELSMADILDINTSNGTVYLKNPLADKDSSLVKVDYTSFSRVYTVKRVGSQKINLNPYLKMREDLIGVPVYVYIVPQYVRNENGEIIQGSINESVIRITTDNSEINSLNPLYNPLAVQLGVVYVSTSSKVEDLVILDTRKRGGGAKDSITDVEVFNENIEAKTYWDISSGYGQSFQYGGFVIIRLPKMLKSIFPDTKDIEDVIRRNITAGVEFKIEDFEGRPWDE